MTINASDIKLFESEIMADTTDGGGRRTSRVVPDGVAGNIFPKVSRLDSVYGRVNLRKIFGAVQTANGDTYAGAHAIITDAPDNAKIHVTLFSTASEFDTRSAARDRIESYVTSGPESRMVLLGRQLPGQQTFMAYQRTEEPLPEIGDVVCLSNEPGSIVTTQQYVRIQSVDHEVRAFEDSTGTFERRVLTIGVGVPLRYEFNGPENASRYSAVNRFSKLRSTTVVDAARYFGIKKLAEAAGANDLTVRVASIYTPIVPTTNRESPISNENISDAQNLVASSTSAMSETLPAFATGNTRYALRGISPGTLVLSGPGVTPVTDNRKGYVGNAEFSATVDYESGTISRTGGTAGVTDVTATYIPAVSVAQPAHTIDIPVTLDNRGTVYVLSMNPLPNPGSVILDYRALGKWYRLRDDAAGSLTGTDSSYGAGTITYATGALVVTLGALPDVDSSVLVSFGSPAHYSVRSGATSAAAPTMQQAFTLPDVPISPDSFSLTYTAGGVDYSATDNSAGTLTGDGIVGSVNYTTGDVSIEYTTRLPDSATNVSCSYQQAAPADPQAPVVLSVSTVTGASTTLSPNIAPGSITGSLQFSGSSKGVNYSGQLSVRDSAGTIVVSGGQKLNAGANGSAMVPNDAVIGVVNYATGVVTINAGVATTVTSYQPYALGSGGVWSSAADVVTNIGAGVANWGWTSNSAASVLVAKTFDANFSSAPLCLDLTATIADSVVPGAIMFTLGGKTFIDRNGVLYNDVSSNTGTGITAGSVDYATGKVSVTHWTDSAAPGLGVVSCLTNFGDHSDYQVQFRTPGSPIRSGSFYVQATTTDGVLVSATSNDSGVINGAHVTGTVNQDSGVVRLKFGQLVTAAGNEAEWWYRAGDVVGGMIFKPTQVLPSTITFNCVVLSNLPLNADILGLDPVRLPMDGRVPIYRPADVVVVHNTSITTLTNPAVANTTYSVGRTDLADVWLEDQTGTKLTGSQYTVDLAAGTVTMAADFVAGALVQPLVAKHRIEDMTRLTDVQINGQLTFETPLSRGYPLDSFVSSALLFGDMKSSVTNVRDLSAFSAWTDAPEDGATAQYNNIDFPIEVLNVGAGTERWRISFTTSTAFQVIGENLGVIASGTTAADCSPVNQLTGQPYFVIRAAGWGGGWSAGNQLRFDTQSATRPMWFARTVLPGASLEQDSFDTQLRGDVDAA